MSVIGKQIKKYRTQKGLTQEQLGQLLGVTTQAVSKWERGGTPDAELLPDISQALGVSIDALFGREEQRLTASLARQICQMKNENAYRYAFRICRAIEIGFMQDISALDDFLNKFIEHSAITTDKTDYFAKMMQDGGVATAMVIIKNLKRGNIMPIVNDLNNYAKEELEYFGVRRQNEENAAIEKAVFNTKFDLNYDFNGFFVIIPIIVIGLIPVAKILIREAITSSVNHTPFTLSTVQILIISILSTAIFFAIALLICLKLKKCPSVQTSYLYYKDEAYHYDQINYIKVSRIKTAKIYVNGKKLVGVSNWCDNYNSLIVWAKKCHIPVLAPNKKSNSSNSLDLNALSNNISMIVAVVVFAIMMIGAAVVFINSIS